MKKAKTKPTDPPPSAFWPGALLALALAEAGLAVFQWSQLLLVRAGGKAVCALNETVNCATVWNSAFASRLHGLLGVPVAGLGVVWGLTAAALSAALLLRARRRAPLEVPSAAVRVAAAVGVLSCISFGVASFRAGAVCLTCLATIALVLGFAAVAFAKLEGPFPPPSPTLKKALVQAGLVAVAFHLALLYPGLKTPNASGTSLSSQEGLARPSSRDEAVERVQRFFAQLPPAERQRLADFHAAFRASPPLDVSRFSPRLFWGSAQAPMRLVEFTDIRCGHCRSLVETLDSIKRAIPDGMLSIEPRHFPLDKECNPALSMSDGTGVRCLGAKAQICLEGAQDYWELRHRLFEAQESLTQERVLQIASSGSVSKERLLACIQSEQTAAKLQEDISFAELYQPQGTPLVLVNGRMAAPMASWLYAMAMVGGDVDSKAFQALPPPRGADLQGTR